MEDEENMIPKLMRKTSILILFSIAVSMLVPVVSYASDLMKFIYRPAYDVYSRPELTGYIYTKDPNSVSVRANNGSGSVTQVTYSNVYGPFLYDDNNTPYYSVDYNYRSLNLVPGPSSLSVDLEGSSYNLNGVPNPSYPGVYSYSSSLSADLDSYRMPGQYLFPIVTGSTYLPSGTELVKFTPSKIGNNVNVININLPYDFSTKIIADSTELGDFEITDLSVTASVYSKRLTFSSGGNLEFDLDTPLVQGHEYLVKLSSRSSGDEIMLPIDGVYQTSVDISHWVGNFPSGYYVEENSVYFRNMTIGNPVSNPTPDPTPDPTPVPPPAQPSPPSNPNQQIVNGESLKNGSKEKVAVDIANDTKQVLLPVIAADSVGDRKLELKNDNLSVEIPPEVLKKLQSMVSADQLTGAQISFEINRVSETDTVQSLNNNSGNANLKLKVAGDVYDFKLSVITADGKETALSLFDQPIKLRLKVRSDANPALLGIYYIADNGKLEYIGGQLIDGEIVADVHHFSTYAALEYDRTFDDVPAQYWASNVIKELTAKQIVNGASDNTFAPMQQMTRAEFATLIARTLNLTAVNKPVFSDVDSANIHSGAIAAVNEAGIILGRSMTKFAPNDPISREEMAAMIIRAYEYKNGKKAEPAAAFAYSDRKSVSNWALPYIDTASGIGFVKGRGNATFAPKQFLTRAEGAQVIYLLLKSN
jgi:hypothetical protein